MSVLLQKELSQCSNSDLTLSYSVSHSLLFSILSLFQTKQKKISQEDGWMDLFLALTSCGCLPVLFGESCLHSCCTSTEPSTYPYHIMAQVSVNLAKQMSMLYKSNLCVCVCVCVWVCVCVCVNDLLHFFFNQMDC